LGQFGNAFIFLGNENFISKDMKKQNVYLVGPMGAGKTSIGQKLSQKLGLQFYDSDQIIEKRTGATIPWIYDIEGEEGFQQREMKVIAEFTQLQGILLATGGGTVDVEANRISLGQNGIIIYLKTSLDDQIERIKYSKKRPITAEEEARREMLKNLRKQREPFYEELADIVYDTDGKSLPKVVNELLQKLQCLNL